MAKFHDTGNFVKLVLEQLTHYRPSTATIYSIDGDRVSIQAGGFPAIISSVRVIGDVSSLSSGDVVDILWDRDRPVVLAGGGSSPLTSSNSSIQVDNRTLETSYEGVRVKRGGISARHLDFDPALQDHTHNDPLYAAGWRFSDNGVLYNGSTSLHPDGEVVLGEESYSVKLSSRDELYRIWVGSSAGQAAPFSVDKYGKIKSTAGEIGGWIIGEDGIQSDVGSEGPRAEINSEQPYIQLGGATYLDGEGFWVGKHGSVYRLRIGSQAQFMQWDGQNLLLQGNVQSADFSTGVSGWQITVDGDAEFNDAIFRGEIEAETGSIGGWTIAANALSSGAIELNSLVPSISLGATGYLTGSGFWLGKDTDDINKFYIGTTDSYIVWDGDSLIIAGDFESSNYIPGVSGWRLDPAGDAEFFNVKVRGAIESSVLSYGEVLAVDGGILAAKAAVILSADVTVSSSDVGLTIEIPSGIGLEEVDSYFAAGDVLRVKSGNLDLWMSCVSATNEETHWEVVVSKLSPVDDVDLLAGATVVNYGASGDGVVEIDGSAPLIRMFTHDGSPHEGVKNFLIIGELDGHYDIDVPTMGFGVGDPNKLSDYFVITEAGLEMSGVLRINARDISTGSGVWIGRDGFRVGNPSGAHILWDGVGLSIVGDITITGGSGIENLSGVGALATQSSVDWESQVTGAGKPENGATNGATWGVNLSGVPAKLQDPSGSSGLFLASDKMGYYDGGEWVTYIDNQGRFYFRGTGGAYIAWEPTSNKLLGSNGDGDEQWYASSEDGKLYAGDGSVVLDEYGIRVIGNRAAFYFEDEGSPGEPVGTIRIDEDLSGDKIIRIISGLDASDTNLITNGGFETDTTGWTMGGNGVAPARSTDEYYEGAASLKFTPHTVTWENLLDESGDPITDEAGNIITVLSPTVEIVDTATSNDISLEEGASYAVHFYAYHPDKDYMAFSAYLEFYNSLDELVRTKKIAVPTITYDSWNHYQDTFSSRSGEVKVVLVLEMDQGYGGDDTAPEPLYVDTVGIFAVSLHDAQIEIGNSYITLDADEVYLPESNPTSDWQAAPKKYVDDSVDGFVALTGNETIAGVKTFTSIPVMPASDPTTDNQAVRKAYVDALAYVEPIIPAARVTHATDQNIANDTTVTLAFDTEIKDTDTIHDNVTNNSRLTCKTAGLYHIFANVRLSSSSTGDRLLVIYHSNGNIICYQSIRARSGGPVHLFVSTDYELAVNDYVYAAVWQNSGGTLAAVTAAEYSPIFGMTYQGKVS